MKKTLPAFCCLLLAASAAAEIRLSGPLSPELAMDVAEKGGVYSVRLTGEAPHGKIRIKLGAAGEKALFRTAEKLPAEIKIPIAEIGGNAPFRLALEAEYFNADGTLRQREIFRAPAFGDTLPANPALWEVFDIAAYRSAEEDRAKEIAFTVEQPFAGKLSVVIEKPDGTRIRNLVSGLEYAPGKHRIVWDGRNEFGAQAAPGEYRFRAAAHPGLRPQFKMQFANGDETMFSPFGSNHGTMSAMAANSKNVFAAASITEGGHAIIMMTPEGKFVRGFRQLSGCGIQEVFLAADEKNLYVVNDGRSWSGKTDPPAITLTVYNTEDGTPVTLKGKKTQLLRLYAAPKDSKGLSLRGAALLDGKLFISNARTNTIMVIDAATGEETANFPLQNPGVLAVRAGKLLAISGNELGELDAQKGSFRALFTLPFAPRGLAAGPDGLYASGAEDETLKVLDNTGKIKRSLGVPGGNYAGKWNPDRLVEATGVAFDAQGKLWTAEKRSNPKRLVRMDAATGKTIYEKIGCPPYGSPGVGFDPLDAKRWIGHSCLWEVDVDKKTSKITSVLQKTRGHLNGMIAEPLNYRFIHRDGRTFVFGSKNICVLSELMPDGTLKDLAILADVVNFYRGIGYKDDPAFIAATQKVFPKGTPEGKFRDPSCNYAGILWIDKNGNGKLDEDEFQYTPGNGKFGNFSWGQTYDSLDFVLPYVDAQGKQWVVTLSPDGFLPSGAPNYSVEKAMQNAKPLQSELPQGSRTIADGAVTDGSGGIIINSTPYMMNLTNDGKIRWFYPNKWVNVHGSHNAPLPRPGELQGVLFSIGTAPLDKEGGVSVFAGNHGRYFVFTTDGIYLDELFDDCRVAEVVGPSLIGGEAFGGNFARDEKTKRYYLSAGSSGYRIYTLNGLDKLRRTQGSFKVTNEQLAAAARVSAAQDAESAQPKEALFRLVTGKPNIGGLPTAADWSLTNEWPVRVKAGYDNTNLYLEYYTADSSPWINNGSDWTMLFKTGDSVDFQIGTDPGAKANRSKAEKGDLRLLIAPFQGKNIAVLYIFVNPTRSNPNLVEFASPWRSYAVADVRKLDNVVIKVEPSSGSYRLTATIPLAELGLSDLKGKTLKGDFGVIYGDREGTVNLSRQYWSNKSTGLVNDVPGEIMLDPRSWGTLKFGE